MFLFPLTSTAPSQQSQHRHIARMPYQLFSGACDALHAQLARYVVPTNHDVRTSAPAAGRLLQEDKKKCRKGGQGIIFLTNRTAHPINAAVKVPVLCHFYNRLKPNETVYFRTGDVLATLEVQLARADNDYKRSTAIGMNVLFSLSIVGLLGVAMSLAATAAAPVLLAQAAAASATAASQSTVTGPPPSAEMTVNIMEASVAVADMVKNMVAKPISRDFIRAGRSPHFEVIEENGETRPHLKLQQRHTQGTEADGKA